MFLHVLYDTSYGGQWSLVCLALDWAFENGRSWKKLSTLRETVLSFLLQEDDWKTFLITLENALRTGCNEHVPDLKKVVFISSRYFAIFFSKLALVLGLDHPSWNTTLRNQVQTLSQNLDSGSPERLHHNGLQKTSHSICEQLYNTV